MRGVYVSKGSKKIISVALTWATRKLYFTIGLDTSTIQMSAVVYAFWASNENLWNFMPCSITEQQVQVSNSHLARHFCCITQRIAHIPSLWFLRGESRSQWVRIEQIWFSALFFVFHQNTNHESVLDRFIKDSKQMQKTDELMKAFRKMKHFGSCSFIPLFASLLLQVSLSWMCTMTFLQHTYFTFPSHSSRVIVCTCSSNFHMELFIQILSWQANICLHKF